MPQTETRLKEGGPDSPNIATGTIPPSSPNYGGHNSGCFPIFVKIAMNAACLYFFFIYNK